MVQTKDAVDRWKYLCLRVYDGCSVLKHSHVLLNTLTFVKHENKLEGVDSISYHVIGTLCPGVDKALPWRPQMCVVQVLNKDKQEDGELSK